MEIFSRSSAHPIERFLESINFLSCLLSTLMPIRPVLRLPPSGSAKVVQIRSFSIPSSPYKMSLFI